MLWSDLNLVELKYFSTILTRVMPCPEFVLWMITCERKVRLKLGVVCTCMLGVSRSTSIITIFDNSYQSDAPFCTSNLLNCWFPDDNMSAKSHLWYLSVSY